MRVQLQPGFVLHSRPYGDTSVIVDVISRDFGRVALLAKGQRKTNGRSRFTLTPFTKLLVSWQGKSDLKLLTNAEIDRSAVLLEGDKLYSGFYINELMVRLLPQQDPHPELFEFYDKSLQALDKSSQIEVVLRQFELELLEQMGYGIAFGCEAESGQQLQDDAWYNFISDQGFIRVNAPTMNQQQSLFNGSALNSMAKKDFSDVSVRRQAKRLMRQALADHLGDKPLKSRALFIHH